MLDWNQVKFYTSALSELINCLGSTYEGQYKLIHWNTCIFILKINQNLLLKGLHVIIVIIVLIIWNLLELNIF